MNHIEEVVCGCLVQVLLNDVEHGDYGLLTSLVTVYDKSKKITVEKVMSAPYLNLTMPEKMIYAKLTGLLSEDIKSNLSKYMDVYIEYNKSKHPDWYKNICNISPEEAPERILNYASICLPGMDSRQDSCYFIICVWNNRENKSVVKLFEDDPLLSKCKFKDERFKDKKNNPCTENCQEALGTLEFKDVLEQCRILLAKKLGTTEKKLNDTIAEISKPYTMFSDVYFDNHDGSSGWAIASRQKNKEYRKLFYRPDITQIISDYYEASILTNYNDYFQKFPFESGMDVETYSKVKEVYAWNIKRAGASEDAEKFAEYIIKDTDPECLKLMYGMDIIGHLLSYTTEQLYQYQLDELMGKDKKSDVKSSSEGTRENAAELADLQAKYNKLAEENRKLAAENTSLKSKLNLTNEHHEQSEAESKKNQAEYEKTIKDLKENIKEKDFDLNYDIYRRAPEFAVDYDFSTLKEQLDDYKARLEKDKEVIDILLPDPKKENLPEKPDVSELDMAEVYDKNIVFLGDLTRMGAQALPQYFIKSHFFEKDSPYISQYENGDYVVLMIKGLTHGMFYAARSNYYLNNKPWIYYDGKSFSNLKKTIYYGITDADKKAASENPVTAEEDY